MSDADEIIHHDLRDIVEPEVYTHYLKTRIAIAIKKAMYEANPRITVRELASKVGVAHPQIIRVTNAHNYKLETLLDVLEALDLEIEIVPRQGKGSTTRA